MLKKKNFLLFLLLSSFVFITFANGLNNQLVWDDEQFIYKNIYVQNLKFFFKYFSESATAGAGSQSNYYRPLLTLSFALNWFIGGGKPFVFHFTSILIHAFNTIFIYLIIRKLFNIHFVALLTALLFAFHPVQVESVTYITGRADPLFAFFLLLSILLYLKAEKTNLSDYFYLASVGGFVSSLLSKEVALITPALLYLIEITRERKINKEVLTNTTRKIWLFFAVAIIYFFLRLTFLNFKNILNFYSYQNIYSQNLLVRLFTFCSVLIDYFFLLIFPKNLNMERDKEIITTFLHPHVILMLIFLPFAVFLTIKFLKKKPLLFFSFYWFLIILAPVSGIIPINGIIYEHFLYLPSIGFFLFVSWVCLKISAINKYFSFLIYLFLITVCITLIYRSILRNRDFKDPITFYQNTLKYAPNSHRVHNNLAMAYAEDNRPYDAIREYQKAIKLSDTYPQTHHNLANTYKGLGKFEEAEKEYQKALEIDPTFFYSYQALTDLYLSNNNLNAAINTQIKAASLFTSDPLYPFNIGLLYQKKGKIDQARHWLQQARIKAKNNEQLLRQIDALLIKL